MLITVIFLERGWAQQTEEWYLGQEIVDIRFEGLRTISESELTGVVRPFIGEPFTDTLSANLQGRLYALEYFDLVLPEALSDDGSYTGVTLVFHVKERATVQEIRYEGNEGVRDRAIRDVTRTRVDSLVNNAFIRVDVRSIKELYTERGFLDTEVTSSIERDDANNRVTVIFQIEEGSQTRVREIRFEGNNAFADSTLLGEMKTKPQQLFNKGLLVESDLQEDVRTIETYYGGFGYIDAKVQDVVREVIKDEEDGANYLIITLILDEGNLYTFGGVDLEGNSLFTTAELLSVFTGELGDPVDMVGFQADYTAMRDMYGKEGYINNVYTVNEQRDEEARTLSFNISIVERERAHIENIIIRGNTKTKDNVILRELPFSVGDVFDSEKVQQGIWNLYYTQHFSNIVPQTYPGSEEGLMVIVIDVEEGETAQIGFGLTLSPGNDFPLAGFLQWQDRNFLGRGETIGVTANFSPDTQTGSLRYYNPRIFDTSWGGGGDISYRRTNRRRIYQDIDGDGVVDPYEDDTDFWNAQRVVPLDYLMEYGSHYISLGGSTGYTWLPRRLGRISLTGGVRGGFEYVYYDNDVYSPWSHTIRENHERWMYHDELTSRLAWDTRDNPGSPTRGIILSQRLALAGLVPTSTKNYLKSITRAEFNLPIIPSLKTVLTVSSAFSFLAPKPWNPIPIDTQEDGFYMDGMITARGWYPESDGQSMWDNTVLIKTPIVQNVLAFDIFLDAVGLWKTRLQLDQASLSDMKFSLGAGLRFDNPQLPLGIYLVKKFRFKKEGGINWEPEPEQMEFNGFDLVISFNMDIY